MPLSYEDLLKASRTFRRLNKARKRQKHIKMLFPDRKGMSISPNPYWKDLIKGGPAGNIIILKPNEPNKALHLVMRPIKSGGVREFISGGAYIEHPGKYIGKTGKRLRLSPDKPAEGFSESGGLWNDPHWDYNRNFLTTGDLKKAIRKLKKRYTGFTRITGYRSTGSAYRNRYRRKKDNANIINLIRDKK